MKPIVLLLITMFSALVLPAQQRTRNPAVREPDTANIIQAMMQHLDISKEKALQLFAVKQYYQKKYLAIMSANNISADERHQQFALLDKEKNASLGNLLNKEQLQTLKELAKPPAAANSVFAERRKQRNEQIERALKKREQNKS